MEIKYPPMPQPVSSYKPREGKNKHVLWDGNQMRGYAMDTVIFNLPSSPYQARVGAWLVNCFGNGVSYDKKERNWRFGEEALELLQACGGTKEEAHQLVEYVFNRPIGEPEQEVGGVMVTLAALCLASNMDMMQCAEREIDRVNTKEMIEKIRIKNANKPLRSPLPGVFLGGDPHEEGRHTISGTLPKQHTICGYDPQFLGKEDD